MNLNRTLVPVPLTNFLTHPLIAFQPNRPEVIANAILIVRLLASLQLYRFIDTFRPDSSTESNNDNSPVERRSNTPRHVTSDVRSRTRPTKPPRESKSMDILRAGSNNNR